jgi:hypothetical protein
VASIDDIVAKMKANPKGVRFADLAKVCDHYFGKPRSRGTSHRIYRTPWQGDPRVNIQSAKSQAKAYHVRQVLWAIERIEKDDGKDN